MSKQYPECPLYNHASCRELHNPKVCALVKKDRICTKKMYNATRSRQGTKMDNDSNGLK